MASTIEEFLVKLGYSIDGASQNRFEDSIKSAERWVLGLGASVTAAAIGVAKFTESFASYGDKLYWLAQRSGASASGIEDLAFAAGQLGSTVDAAKGSFEAFGRFMANNPGGRDWLKGLIGDFGNAEDAFVKFGRAMHDQPSYLRNAYAAQMGLDYNFAQSLFSGDFEKELKKRRVGANAIGIDQDEFARQSKEFENKWRDFFDRLKLVAEKAATGLMGPVGDAMEDAAKWVERHGREITSAVASIAASVVSLAKALNGETLPALGGLSTAFGDLLKTIDGVTGGALPKITHSFSQELKNAIETITGLIRALTDLISGDFSSALTKVGDALSSQFSVKPGGIFDRIRRKLGWMPSEDHAGDVPEGDANAAMQYFIGKGWTPEQAAGIAASLQEESGLRANPPGSNDGGKAYGAAQWHADRQADFRRVFGKDIRDASYAEQLAFVDWELRNTERGAGDRLSRATTAAQAGDIVSRYYERPAAVDEAASNRSSLAAQLFGGGGAMVASAASGPTINNSINITVNGAGDPNAIASAVGGEMERQNAILIRQLRPAF